MTMRTLLALVGIAPLMLVNCGGGASGPAPSTQTIGERPGARDVQAGADTLPIIPRDEVQKSQSGAVFQRVANTDIEVSTTGLSPVGVTFSAALSLTTRCGIQVRMMRPLCRSVVT